MKRRVLVLSSCAPPLRGSPVTGGGLRTAQLVAALEQAGFVTELMVEAGALPAGAPAALRQAAFEVEHLAEAAAARRPSVIVCEQWALGARLAESEALAAVPVVLDLHGSLLLENLYRRGGGDFVLDAGAKLDALRRADLVLVPAAAQVHHFASWLTLAGFDPRELPIRVLPLALPDPPPAPREEPAPPLRLLYGGARWPWIDSVDALRTAADVVAGTARAELDVHGYEPPRHGLAYDEALGTWPEVDAALAGRESDGVRLHAGTTHARWRKALDRATVALDLWAPNPERMLAATTRTVEFLWAGLPVVTVQGAAWAEELVGAGAGWTVPPGDAGALRALLRGLAEHPERIAAASRAATELIRTRHAPERAAEALVRFCADPRRPPRAARSLVAGLVARREAHLDEELASLREAHRREHARLVASHAEEMEGRRAKQEQEAARLAAEHRTELERVVEDARRRAEEATAAHRAEVDRIVAAHRAELEQRDAAHRAQVQEVVADWRGQLQEADERRLRELARRGEEQARREVEIRADAAAREAGLRERVRDLESGPLVRVARRVRRRLRAGAAGEAPDGEPAPAPSLFDRLPSAGRFAPSLRLARLFVEHAADHDA